MLDGMAVMESPPTLSLPSSENVISAVSGARVGNIWEELHITESLLDNITPVCQGVCGISSVLACSMWTWIGDEERPQVLLELETDGKSSFIRDSPSMSGEGVFVLGAIPPCGIEQNVTFSEQFNEQEGSRGVWDTTQRRTVSHTWREIHHLW